MDETHAGANSNPHIPPEIVTKEAERVAARREALGIPQNAPALGIALSGGGIRSATVSLGVFQYLAHEEKRVRDAAAAPLTPALSPHAGREGTSEQAGRGGTSEQAGRAGEVRLLSRIDYFSSVSGGGYFGTFFGSLFLPKDEREKGALITPELPARELRLRARAPADPKWKLAAERATDALCDTVFDGSRMTPMRWLRENGRYLVPKGGGDYLYAMAVAVRNFAGLHYVIGISLVAIFLLAAIVRVLGFTYFPEFWVGTVEAWFMPDPGANFWPSVWWAPTLACFALMVVPIATAFFLAQTELKRKRKLLNLPLITAIGVAVLCIIYAIAGEGPQLRWLPTWLHGKDVPELDLTSPAGWGVARLAAAYIGIAAALAAIIYLVTKRSAHQRVRHGDAPPAAANRRELEGEPNATTLAQVKLSQAMMLPLMITLTLAAYALVDTIGQSVYALWTVDASSKWVTGGGLIALLMPLLQKLLPLVTGSGDPTTKSWVRIPMSGLAFVAGVALFVAVASVWSALTHGLIWFGERPVGDPGCVMILPSEAEQRDVTLDAARRIVVAKVPGGEECQDGAEPLGPASWAWLFAPLLVISIFTGRRVGFINLSSLQRYYAGHLMRSYLRASLFAQDPDVERDVRNPTRSDDITVDTYYNKDSLAPVHFINVTMNQTVASGSQLVQRDRKGMNIGIGPMGFSIGNRSFVAWDPATMDYNLGRCPAAVTGEPDVSALPRYTRDTQLVVEPLSIGNWCAISGAAFTTGHGKGTTLGLSLLLALTNVRMGYWWNAEVVKPHPMRAVAADPEWVDVFNSVFGTQSFVLNEMFARYYGTRRSHWYLSDGGHFENTAAYELIRRRVPRIIILDNGHDAAYAFDDIANLVRKARIDLDAEIEFLTALELSDFVDASVRDYFGTPEEFTSDHHEPVYATLAHVRYQEAPDSPGLLLVLKPRVAGIEPLDILNYKDASPDFPQQSTTDQFYDEAQWESYRGLGYWIAEQLFAERDADAPDKWLPRKMFE